MENWNPQQANAFQDHDLYQAALKEMAGGNGKRAEAALQELVELFPEEQGLRDLLVRAQLRATLATSEPIAPERNAPTPLLRRVVLLLLVVTLILIGIAGFAAAYDRLVYPHKVIQQQEQKISTLRRDGQVRIEAEDWAGARRAFQELLALVPDDPEAKAALQSIEGQENLTQKYGDAISARQRGDTQAALDLLRQIEAQQAGYRDVDELIKALQEEEILEAAWQQSENLILSGDLQGAIATLVQIRGQNPDFRRTQVEAQLFQLYVQAARSLIDQAGGDVAILRQAIGYLDQALALQPTQQALVEERRLASKFVTGADAFAQQDWAEAVANWESVYQAQRDYQGQILEEKLRQAYPLAARQRIDQAQGRIGPLSQALIYLDQALAAQPDDQTLLQERSLIVDFLAGAEAFGQEKWDLAITHWGALYAIRPDYQNGLLAENLGQACANSPAPDTNLCPP